MNNLELLSIGIEDIVNRSNNYTVGFMLSMVEPGSPPLDPDEFRYELISEYERNEQVFVPADMKINKDEYEKFFPISPVVLIKEILPYGPAFAAGFEMQGCLKGNEYWGNISTVWSIGDVSEPESSHCPFMDVVFENSMDLLSKKGMWLHIGLTAGWDYRHGIGKLEKFSRKDIIKSNRVCWQRTPEG